MTSKTPYLGALVAFFLLRWTKSLYININIYININKVGLEGEFSFPNCITIEY